MLTKRRDFQRPLGERRYKKLFIVSVEGSKTEPQYFGIFNEPNAIVLIKCLKRKVTDSSPIQALNRMEGHLRKESLKKSDEAWIVVDRDNWTERQLQELLKWAKSCVNHGFALSNPNFEYWLLLHFEDRRGIANLKECVLRLKKYLPNYKKDVDTKKITPEHIRLAIIRAKQRDEKSSSEWPGLWGTSVYKLVEKIINHK